MIKRYFTQAFRQLRQNPVLSTVSILGTSLAIGLSMLFYMMDTLQEAKVYPMQNNDYYLWYSKGNQRSSTGRDNVGNGGLGLPFAHALSQVGDLGDATLFSSGSGFRVSLEDDRLAEDVRIQFTDQNYWKVFDFEFLQGQPYDSVECASGVKKAVITARLARHLFGEANPVGKDIYYQYDSYQVCGVVRNVCPYFMETYAEIWIPYTTDSDWSKTDPAFPILGRYTVLFRAKSKSDIPLLRERILQNVKDFNDNLRSETGLYAVTLGQPDNHYWHTHRYWSNVEPDWSAPIQLIILITIFMLIPAVNIASVHSARMIRRLSELGVRRAYGATRWDLLGQLVGESFLQTLLGGLLGLLLAVGLAYVFRGTLVASIGTSLITILNTEDLSPAMLLSLSVFLWTFLACLVLNLVASGAPAIRVTRHSIVDSLNFKR